MPTLETMRKGSLMTPRQKRFVGWLTFLETDQAYADKPDLRRSILRQRGRLMMALDGGDREQIAEAVGATIRAAAGWGVVVPEDAMPV